MTGVTDSSGSGDISWEAVTVMQEVMVAGGGREGVWNRQIKIHWDVEPRLSLFPCSPLYQGECSALWWLPSSPREPLAIHS